MMLSLVYEDQVVYIFSDDEGLDDLILKLQGLRRSAPDHVHLMTPAWGGYELTEFRDRESATVVHHLQITKE